MVTEIQKQNCIHLNCIIVLYENVTSSITSEISACT